MDTSRTATPTSRGEMSKPSATPSRSLKLRQMLQSAELEFLMEAHNGLSARIVKEAGFKGIWGSGLSISAQFGVRDNNEASWTQVVDNLEFMADASDLPILLDGDTGYGNFNNMRRLVRKLEQRGIAGVCIEDKQFPKTNSFLNGERQPLADIEEFVGKIAAGTPIEAIQHERDRMSVPESILGSGEHYMLEVQGDSMINAGILDGDYVVIRKTDTAHSGEIVVALVMGEEATLKRLRRKGASIALEAANPDYETRIFGPDQVDVQGKLVGLIRRYH